MYDDLTYLFATLSRQVSAASHLARRDLVIVCWMMKRQQAPGDEDRPREILSEHHVA